MAAAKKTAVKAKQPAQQPAQQPDATSAPAADATGDELHDDQAAGGAASSADANVALDGGQPDAADGGQSDAAPLRPAAEQAMPATALIAAVEASGGAVVQQYLVVSNLEHDLVLYAPGDTLPLTDKQAEPLLGHTVVLHTGRSNTEETTG